jgi:hypothetical protein
MSLRLVARGLSFAAGLLLLFIAAAFLMVLSTGNFTQGRTAALLSVVAYLAAAMPLLAWPFSTAVARVLLAIFLIVLSVLFLAAAFNPPPAVAAQGVYQWAAIAFAILVVSRVLLAWRGRRLGRRSAP